MKPFSIIVAFDQNLGIGKNGQLPWHLPADLKRFREITISTDNPKLRNAVVMGRKTWDSLPEEYRPLSGRLNVVLTRNCSLVLPENVIKAEGLTETLMSLEQTPQLNIENIFVIGGEAIFREALKSPACEAIYVTHIIGNFHCDTFFPEFSELFELKKISEDYEHNEIVYSFCKYIRR